MSLYDLCPGLPLDRDQSAAYLDEHIDLESGDCSDSTFELENKIPMPPLDMHPRPASGSWRRVRRATKGSPFAEPSFVARRNRSSNSSVTVASTSNGFLTIPPELRLHILSFVLFSPSNLIPHEFPDADETIYQYLRTPIITSASLLKTCRQVRTETLHLLNFARYKQQITYRLDVLVKNEEHIYPTWTNVPVRAKKVDCLYINLRLYEDIPGSVAGKQQYWANLLWNERLVFTLPDLMFDPYLMALNRILSHGTGMPNVAKRHHIHVGRLVINFVFDEDRISEKEWAPNQAPILPQRTVDSDDVEMKKFIHWSTIVDTMEKALDGGHWPTDTFIQPVLNKVDFVVVAVNGREKKQYKVVRPIVEPDPSTLEVHEVMEF